MNRETAVRIVDAIIDNLRNRKGLEDEWDSIDDEIRHEIRERWIQIVMEKGKEVDY